MTLYVFLLKAAMKFNVFICMVLMSSLAAEKVMCASIQGHFPLKDCYKHDTDLLSLLDYDDELSWLQQLSLVFNMNWDLIQQSSSGNSSHWMVANVADLFSAHNETINVSHWSFQGSDRYWEFRVPKTDILEVPIRGVRSRMELKIQIIERLFAEMSGVRNNAEHVGFVFLNGKNLTQKEIRKVPSIVQRLSSKVKIFTVIFGNKLVEEIVYLTDTLLLPTADLTYFKKYLLMAMCETCEPGWVPFKQTTGLNMLSCFRISSGVEDTTWLKAYDSCTNDFNGNLAGIETEEEMFFLQNYLFGNFKDLTQHNIKYHIGLTKDLGNYANRFQWVTRPRKFRPLLIHHWLPGQPCRDCENDDCVAWQFTNTTKRDKDNNKTSEGWININCHSKFNSQPLCEIVLPRKINDVDFIFSIPETEHTNFTMPNKHFIIYESSIISISANVPNSNFLQFLRNSNLDFPIFDCGEDAGDRRYISYNMVCDFVDHCSNRRDELLCLNPMQFEDNGFYCKSGKRLHHKEYECDGLKDCRDDSDEEFCDRRNCYAGQCYNGSCLSVQWENNVQVDCFIHTVSLEENTDFLTSLHESKPPKNNKRCALVCGPGMCVGKSERNDSVIDCKGPEGLIAKTMGKLESANACKNSFGHNMTPPECHYIRDRYGGIVGCTDMSHLRDCENFQCGQGFVKCYNSYCIPHYYLRDGRADCPTGEDEQLLYTGPCTGYFACWDSNICLHPDLVCDGHNDCPYEDDELDCHNDCLEGFRCIAGTVSVSDYNRSIPLNEVNLYAMDRQIRYLDLSGLVLYFVSLSYHNFVVFLNLKVLILSKCNLDELVLPMAVTPPCSIQKLDISYNKFEAFAEDEYNHFYKHINYLNISHNRPLKSLKNLRFRFLEIFDLSFTSLSHLNDSVFTKLPKLKHLNLSHSLISKFTRQYFSPKLTLQTLDLRGILTQDLDDYLFHDLTISQALYTDLFQICCPQIQGLIISPRACIAPVDVDVISSCANLLGIDIQRFLLWIVAILAVLGNMTVIVYRVIWDRSVLQTGYGLFVTNLGISDFIMGVYLFMIAGADSFYRDSYVLYDKSWRNSVVCKIAGFMACLSCEASAFFVFLITLDRFFVMKFPFGQMKFTWSQKTIAVATSWVASVLLSIVPIVLNFDIYSSNAMCLGLPLTNSQAKGWEYSVAVFIVFNLIMFVFVACGQYAIFRAMSENRISKRVTNMPSSRRAEDITVAKQLSLVVLSNFLFWFPVGIMGLMSFGGHEISSQVYAWTTVFLLPINSAANPVLYTIPALLERWEKFKRGPM